MDMATKATDPATTSLLVALLNEYNKEVLEAHESTTSASLNVKNELLSTEYEDNQRLAATVADPMDITDNAGLETPLLHQINRLL